MTTLKRFGALVVLLSAFCLTAVGGEVPTIPCAAPGEVNTPPSAAPGETSSPPGESQTAMDSANPGEMPTPPIFSEVVTIPGVAFELVMLW